MTRKTVIIIISSVVLLIILIVLYVVFLAPKTVGGTKSGGGNQTPPANVLAGPNASTNTGAALVVPPTVTDAQKAGITIGAKNPPQTIDTVISNNAILVGANVYAGQSTTNVYDTCDFTSNKVLNTFNTGKFIGTYISNDGTCLTVAMNVSADVIPFLSFTSVQLGTTNGVLFNTSIYFVNPANAGGYTQVPPVDVNGCDSNDKDVNGNGCSGLF